MNCQLLAKTEDHLYILRHDRHALRVDRAQVRVLEQTNQVRLSSLLKRSQRRALEPNPTRLHLLSQLPNQPLERQPTDQQLRALLVLTNLAQSLSRRTVPIFLTLRCIAPLRRTAPRIGMWIAAYTRRKATRRLAWRLSRGSLAPSLK